MRQRPVPGLFVFGFASIVAACSSGGGGGSDGFQLPRISMAEGAVWKVNQEIVFTFSAPVDFSTVSLNTINIQTETGIPATGTFSLRAPNVVVFQPNCPREDNANTGLTPGNVEYVLRVPGRSSGVANTVRSTTGDQLQVTQTRNFSTPAVGEEFLDTVIGPPEPVVRAEGSTLENATYIELANDPDQRVYFERTPTQDLVLSVPGFQVPLNLYSDVETQIAVVVEFNQALNPSAENISPDLMRLEYFDNSAVWQPLETRVTLLANCTDGGARVRLDPIGILPQGSQIRAVILDNVTDIVGEATTGPITNFAVAETRAVEFTSLAPQDTLSDEFPETFDFGGSGVLSFEDTEVLSASPSADWGDGLLTAAFQFEGTGGPSGTFDWFVDESLVIDTNGGVIIGADGITTQTIQEGRIDVRNMTIDENVEVVVRGAFPLRIDATGDVIIRGVLDLSGANARDVSVPNTGDIIERGGRGGPGGGAGGDANQVATSSTARGGSGQGPGAEVNAGGQGGESALALESAGKDARRPGGGGGGRFAVGSGLNVATKGGDGNPNAKSAVDINRRPLGGAVNAGPFSGSTNDDFFGTKAVSTAGNVTSLIRGELTELSGGFGGGGGGNANTSDKFPTPNWTPSSDEKGGAGGGGGGALHLRALGKIQFGRDGQIKANGGRGGIGENVLNQDHVGGNGGSGSGGHIVLETASYVDFTDGGLAPDAAVGDWLVASGGPAVIGVPIPAPNAGLSTGGAGGPGVIQIHVPNSIAPPGDDPSSTDIVLPDAALALGNPIDGVTTPVAHVLVPAFSARSIARSEWISLGGAEQNPGGAPPSLVQFLFDGTNTAPGPDEGKILAAGGRVQELPALVDEALEGNANVAVLPDRVTLRLGGASLDAFTSTTSPGGISNDLYLRTPSLLEDFVLRLKVAAESQDFRVASAAYDEGTAGAGDEFLSLTVDESAGDLQDFIVANTALGTVAYELRPRYFRVLTDGVDGDLPDDAFVRIRFQGTGADVDGEPDEANPLVDWTADISQFNALAPGQLQFFRFEVEFDLAATGPVDSGTETISLDFLRIPFVF